MMDKVQGLPDIKDPSRNNFLFMNIVRYTVSTNNSVATNCSYSASVVWGGIYEFIIKVSIKPVRVLQ